MDGIRGKSKMRVECFPAFNYARGSHTTWIEDSHTKFQHESRVVFQQIKPKEEYSSPFGKTNPPSLLTMDLRCVFKEGNELDSPRPPLLLNWILEDSREAGHEGLGVSVEFDLLEGQRLYFVFRESPELSQDHYGDLKAAKDRSSFHCDPRYLDLNPCLSSFLLDSLLQQTIQYW